MALKPQSPGPVPAGGLHPTQLPWALGPTSVTLIPSSLEHGRTVHSMERHGSRDPACPHHPAPRTLPGTLQAPITYLLNESSIPVL